MSGARTRFSRWITLVVLPLAAGGLAAAAADHAEGGLSTARRDYEALKTLSNETVAQPKVNLPPAPPLELKTEEPVLPTSARLRRKDGKGVREGEREPSTSRNWLIEAMTKPEPSASATPGSSGPATDLAKVADSERGPELIRLMDALAGRQQREEQKASADDPERAAIPTAVVNPLDSFMAAWMTPPDYELLARKSNGGPHDMISADSGPLRGTAVDPAAVNPPPVPAFAEPLGLDRPASANPYLRDLTPLLLPPLRGPEFAPIAAAPPSDAMARSMTPVMPEPPAMPSFSEQLKAQKDEKYFRQLKRF